MFPVALRGRTLRFGEDIWFLSNLYGADALSSLLTVNHMDKLVGVKPTAAARQAAYSHLCEILDSSRDLLTDRRVNTGILHLRQRGKIVSAVPLPLLPDAATQVKIEELPRAPIIGTLHV